jgi:hypothetical protein
MKSSRRLGKKKEKLRRRSLRYSCWTEWGDVVVKSPFLARKSPSSEYVASWWVEVNRYHHHQFDCTFQTGAWVVRWDRGGHKPKTTPF